MTRNNRGTTRGLFIVALFVALAIAMVAYARLNAQGFNRQLIYLTALFPLLMAVALGWIDWRQTAV